MKVLIFPALCAASLLISGCSQSPLPIDYKNCSKPHDLFHDMGLYEPHQNKDGIFYGLKQYNVKTYTKIFTEYCNYKGGDLNITDKVRTISKDEYFSTAYSSQYLNMNPNYGKNGLISFKLYRGTCVVNSKKVFSWDCKSNASHDDGCYVTDELDNKAYFERLRQRHYDNIE